MVRTSKKNSFLLYCFFLSNSLFFTTYSSNSSLDSFDTMQPIDSSLNSPALPVLPQSLPTTTLPTTAASLSPLAAPLSPPVTAPVVAALPTTLTSDPITNSQQSNSSTAPQLPLHSYVNRWTRSDHGIEETQPPYTKGSAGAKQVTFKNKSENPDALKKIAKTRFIGTGLGDVSVVMPPNIFLNNKASNEYKAMIDNFLRYPGFKSMFTKLHIIVLHQLYEYLLSIYTTLNMVHIDDLEQYVTLENVYGINKKTLIINYLIEIIEAQLNRSLQHLFPGMPQSYATRAGMSIVQTDQANRLDLMLVDMERVALASFKQLDITADDWTIILGALENKEYQDYIDHFSLPVRQSIIKKMHFYLEQSMDLSGKKQLKNAVDFQKDVAAALASNSKPTPRYTSFFKQLEKNEQQLLIEMLNSLKESFANSTLISDVQSLIGALGTYGQEAALGLTYGQSLILHHLVNYCSFVGPLRTTIDALQKTQTALATKSIIGITDDTMSAMKKMIVHGLLFFENTTDKVIDSYVTIIQAHLDKKSSDLPVKYQKIYRDYSAPLSDPQRIYVYAQVESDATKMFGDDFDRVTKNFQNAVGGVPLSGSQKAIAPIPLENYLAGLSAEDLLILLVTYRKSSVVCKNRIFFHSQETSLLTPLCRDYPGVQGRIMDFLNDTNYSHLFGVVQQIDAAGKGKKAAVLLTISDLKKTILKDYLAILATLDPLATDQKTQGALQIIESFYDTTDHLLLSLAKADPADAATLAPVYTKFKKATFTLNDLSKEELKAAKSIATQFLTILNKAVDGKTLRLNEGVVAIKHPLSDLNQVTIESISDILYAAFYLSDMQFIYQKSTASYLQFFTQYLSILESDLVLDKELVSVSSYRGLDNFITEARALADNEKANGLDTMSPRLFFYDNELCDTIKMTAMLARLVEGTDSICYPTFGIDLALSLNPQSQDPKQSNTIEISLADELIPLVVPSLTLGTDQLYSPKFFFRDEFGNVMANGMQKNLDSNQITSLNLSYTDYKNSLGTCSVVPWINKKKVPTQNSANADYMYVPSKTRRKKSLEGFFMNIPMVTKDHTKKGEFLVRLYEQPLLPQPDWLNSVQGVVTMLRGCLGDFASLLTLNEPIFDASLELIFKSSLQRISGQLEGLPQGTSIDMSNLDELENQSQELLIREHVIQENAQKAQTLEGA